MPVLMAVPLYPLAPIHVSGQGHCIYGTGLVLAWFGTKSRLLLPYTALYTAPLSTSVPNHPASECGLPWALLDRTTDRLGKTDATSRTTDRLLEELLRRKGEARPPHNFPSSL